MQKVVWPTMIVNVDSVMLPKLKAVFRAMPVTIPGSASGRTNIRLTTSLPDHVLRWVDDGAHEASTRASAVAPSATCRDRPSERRMSGSFQVGANHLSVRPGIGQLSMLDVLKA